MSAALWRLALLFAIGLLASDCARAHATSTSYLTVNATRSNADLGIDWDVSVRDLHWLIDLDPDADSRISWGEIEARRATIGALAAAHLALQRDGVDCATSLADVRLTQHADGPHLSLSLRATCPAEKGPLEIGASLFFAEDASQRTLLDVRTPSGSWTSVLSPDSPKWVQPAGASSWASFGRFVGQGIWHVWLGFDHVAFLLLLLLPSVVVGGRKSRGTTPSMREALVDIATIVTAFTLAHSLTLALAATGTVTLPPAPVEAAIAASIVVAGVLNLVPRAARVRLWLAFGFGLVHGFGFANALSELGLEGSRLAPVLAGFNVGVELGQLGIVALVLPALLRLRRSSFYGRRFMPAASLATAIAGAGWLVARI